MALPNLLSLESSQRRGRLSEGQREVAGALGLYLADLYMLNLKTMNYHWNVEGPHFHQIHELTEKHYTKMQKSIDMVAERIRMLGFYAPGSIKEYQQVATIEESASMPIDERQMILNLEADHAMMSRKLQEFSGLAEENHDASTADLFNELRLFHEEAGWMLRSMSKTSLKLN